MWAVKKTLKMSKAKTFHAKQEAIFGAGHVSDPQVLQKRLGMAVRA